MFMSINNNSGIHFPSFMTFNVTLFPVNTVSIFTLPVCNFTIHLCVSLLAAL